MSSNALHSHKNNINPIEIMKFMTHQSLHQFKPKGSNAPLIARVKSMSSDHRKGIVFVSSSKGNLSQGKGYVVTSYETLHKQNQKLTHWTPNTFRGGTYQDVTKRYIKGHTRDNLQQVNVIAFDIDTKSVHPYDIFIACNELGLPQPNVLLDTPRGYHGFIVLDQPFYVTSKTNFKSLQVAGRLADNVLEALRQRLPIDKGCVPFGFFRIPNDENVVYFSDTPANTDQLLAWSKQYEKQNKRKTIKVIPDGAANYTDAEWFHALVSADHVVPGQEEAGRNNTLFSLALACYGSGKSFEETYDLLDEWNSRLRSPLKANEFNRVLKSAYSGKYQGVKRDNVEVLLETWTDGSVTFKGGQGWYKFKKAREDRERSHYNEWEEDILTYLETHRSPESAYLEGSLNSLAETFGMAVSSLKEVLKHSKRIVKEVVGRGRGAVTKIAARDMLEKQTKDVQVAENPRRGHLSSWGVKPSTKKQKHHTADSEKPYDIKTNSRQLERIESSILNNEPVCQYKSYYLVEGAFEETVMPINSLTYSSTSALAPVPKNVPDQFVSALWNRGFKDGRFIFSAWGKVHLAFKAFDIPFKNLRSSKAYLTIASEAIGITVANKGSNLSGDFTNTDGFLKYLYGTMKGLIANYREEELSCFVEEIEGLSLPELLTIGCELEEELNDNSMCDRALIEEKLFELELEESAARRRKFAQNGSRIGVFYDWLKD
ncbi:primase C-terminal domain-containing protein [Cytobacillus sp. Sa5YUA1]|uniref:Primase C-terminal domain-containing protein n=1 Tax=Cytobacillus stercorigallinarum TaxID=2762240 RepID=A0ABR8QVT0_9BACI|nr:primase C-terminal domain-containing protein [Cytobacillus stercorigallinarum]MBD7939641.1 primase C-terminal domain-containing protein [Cytobacillus stercorigallinarum]